MEYRIDRFAGLNQETDEMITGAKYAAQAVNVCVEGGALSNAKGDAIVTQAALTGGIGTLGMLYERDGGQSDARMIAVNEAGVYEWSEGAWVCRYSGAGGKTASCLNYQHDGEDILLIADGQRPVLRWDGETMAALTGCSRLFSQLALHYERVWGSGLSSEPDAVYWSRPFDPEDWTGDEDLPEAGGGVLLIPTWNGGSVRAIRTLFDDVLVFKDEDVYRIVGTYPGNYEVVRVHGVVGAAAPNAIAATADACYFLSGEGLCVYNGISAAPATGERARHVMARVNKAAIGCACAAVHQNVLYLALPLDDAQVNSAVLEYDLKDGSCVLREPLRADGFLRAGEALYYAGGDGRVYRYGAGGGEAPQALWQTPWTDLGEPGIIKRLNALSMHASGALRLTLETESARVVRRLQLGDFIRPVTLRLGLRGRRFRLTIENQNGAVFLIKPGLSIQIDKE